MKLIHVILSIALIGVIVSVVGFIQYSDVPPPAMARFIDVSILGDGEMLDDVPVIRLGRSATISLDVEKLSSAPINDIMIKSSFTNSENGDLLLLDKTNVHASLKMNHEDYLEYTDEGIKTDPFQGTDKTGMFMITLTAINPPKKFHNDTVNVVLYADGVEMDRLAFDVIVKNSGL